MAAKAILVLCAQALFLKTISSQCIGNAFNAGFIGNGVFTDGLGLMGNGLGYGPGCGVPGIAPAGFAASSGGGFAVTSASPIAPTGLSVLSENAIEGALTIGGQLPFLGAVALEGALPTAGSGAISYGCGNGAVGITNEGIGAGPVVAAGPYGPGPTAGPLYGPGFAAGPVYGPGIGGGIGYNGLGGCGCGAYY